MEDSLRDGTWIRKSAQAGPDSCESRELLTDREYECLASSEASAAETLAIRLIVDGDANHDSKLSLSRQREWRRAQEQRQCSQLRPSRSWRPTSCTVPTR